MDVTVNLSPQELTFRSHCESKDCSNQGNFLETMVQLVEYCYDLRLLLCVKLIHPSIKQSNSQQCFGELYINDINSLNCTSFKEGQQSELSICCSGLKKTFPSWQQANDYLNLPLKFFSRHMRKTQCNWIQGTRVKQTLSNYIVEVQNINYNQPRSTDTLLF